MHERSGKTKAATRAVTPNVSLGSLGVKRMIGMRAKRMPRIVPEMYETMHEFREYVVELSKPLKAYMPSMIATLSIRALKGKSGVL